MTNMPSLRNFALYLSQYMDIYLMVVAIKCLHFNLLRSPQGLISVIFKFMPSGLTVTMNT